ncbi:hypothetical protein DYB32_000566 [Aphanomyces invadans]|uniref:Nuclear pore complex protein n=1 Tax=Aphanomyces invadans TaxID=157072 RepID=A0A3R6WTR6_9STRA|nr:hypothetical protein DYB32_000566 [Aphanomyces invadans]
MVGGPYKHTNDLILAAETSLALLAQMDDGDVGGSPRDLCTDTHYSEDTRKQYAQSPDFEAFDGSDLAELTTTAPVESSVLDGRAHIKVQFPDGTVEYIDVNAATTTVGTALALAWKKRNHTARFLDKKKLRGFFQGREVAQDWFLLDCGLALEGTLQIHIAQSTEWTSLASATFSSNNLFISSISNAYQTESERQSDADSSMGGIVTSKPVEWLEHQVRPEEQEFAAALERFYQKIDMVDEPNAICQHILTEYTDILQNEMAKQENAATTSPYQLHPHSSRAIADVNVWEELRNERNTWRLLIELRQLSIQSQASEPPSILDEIDLDADTTDMDAIASLEYGQYFAVKKTVLNWLELIASEQVSVTNELRSMQHSRTLHRVKQRSLSFSVDPDSTLRDGDFQVDNDDAEDEADLLKSVWQLLRAGQPREAAELCIQLGQPWRAASLNGGDFCGSCDNDDGGVQRWGNPFRMVWKSMCWQFAQAPLNDGRKLHKGKSLEAREYESIIYGALSGNTAVLLRSALCESWEDHCWALLSAAMKYEQDAILLRLLKVKADATDLFLENNPDYVRVVESFVEQTKPMARFTAAVDKIFDEVAASPNDVVRRQGNHPHRRIQSKLVVSDVDAIVSSILKPFFVPDATTSSDFSWDLQLNSTLPSDALPPQLVRFAAHFVLFMTTTGESFDPLTGYLIQLAYIRHLIKHDQRNLVALYASRLPDDGRASVYVQFLTSIRNADTRQDCLKSIAKFCHNPDLFSQITKDAVERIVQHESDDMTRIHALRLLCLDPLHRGELLHQANWLARQFVVENKQSLLKTLFESVPNDSLAVIDDSCQSHVEAQDADTPFSWRQYSTAHPKLSVAIREYLGWMAFVAATNAYEEWRHVVSHANGGGLLCFDDEEKRVKVVTYHATHAISLLFDVLQFEGGWLSKCLDDASMVASSESIRAACLPFIVFSLYRVCSDAIDSFSDLQHYPPKAKQDLAFPFAQKALHLASVVANEHYKVYRSFHTDQLKQLLHLLQQSASSMIALKDCLLL